MTDKYLMRFLGSGCLKVLSRGTKASLKSIELWFIVSFNLTRVVHPICLERNDVAWSKLIFGIACTLFCFSSFFVFSVWCWFKLLDLLPGDYLTRMWCPGGVHRRSCWVTYTISRPRRLRSTNRKRGIGVRSVGWPLQFLIIMVG